MKFSIKKYFIPDKDNNFEPSFFKRTAVMIMALILCGIFLIGLSLPQTQRYIDYLASVYPAVLVSSTNDARTNLNHETQLVVNPLLTKAAQLKAQDMAARGYFSHNSPDGKTPWYWFDMVGYSFKYAGENLAVNFQDSQEIINAWLKSPLHRANILNPQFAEVGIATAEGNYKGKNAIFVVQLFGTPSVQQFSDAIRSRIKTAPVSAQTESAKNLISITIPEVSEKQVAGEFASNVEPSVWQKILASPHTSIDWIYVAVIAAVMLLIMLTFFWKIQFSTPTFWLNSFLLILIISLILIANNYTQTVGKMII